MRSTGAEKKQIPESADDPPGKRLGGHSRTLKCAPGNAWTWMPIDLPAALDGLRVGRWTTGLIDHSLEAGWMQVY